MAAATWVVSMDLGLAYSGSWPFALGLRNTVPIACVAAGVLDCRHAVWLLRAPVSESVYAGGRWFSDGTVALYTRQR